MARYRIVQWHEIPSLVEAMDAEHTVRDQLSQRFQDLIDALAMREGATTATRISKAGAPGSSRAPRLRPTVAHAVAAELEEGFQALVTRRFLGPPP